MDSFIELTTKKYMMNNILYIFQEEKVVLVDQIFIVDEKLIVLEAKNQNEGHERRFEVEPEQ